MSAEYAVLPESDVSEERGGVVIAEGPKGIAPGIAVRVGGVAGVATSFPEDGKVIVEREDGKVLPYDEREVEIVDSSQLDGDNSQSTPQNDSGEPEPVGVGKFGEIYDQFKGKVKEAVAFLLRRKNGEAVGALHHGEVGDISVVYGNDGYGLAHIAKKHPEVLSDLQGTIDGMVVTSQSDNRIVLESSTHRAVISKMLGNEPTSNWLLTAYEKKNPASASSSDIETEPEGKQNGTATLQNEISQGEDSENKSDMQEGGVNTPAIPVDAKGEPMYESSPVEATIADIYNDPDLDEDEADAFVQAKIDGATKRIAQLEKKKPKMGESKVAFKEAKAKWREQLEAEQASLAYWQGVQEARAKESTTSPQLTPQSYGQPPYQGRGAITPPISQSETRGELDANGEMGEIGEMSAEAEGDDVSERDSKVDKDTNVTEEGSVTEGTVEEETPIVEEQTQEETGELTTSPLQDSAQSQTSGGLSEDLTEVVGETDQLLAERKRAMEAWLQAEEGADKDAKWGDYSQAIDALESYAMGLSDEQLAALQTHYGKGEVREIDDEISRRDEIKVKNAQYDELLSKQYPIERKERKGTGKLEDALSKDVTRPVMTGVYHDEDGYAVATDAKVLVADKREYNGRKKGKIIGKDGKEIPGNYPKWKLAIPVETEALPIDLQDLSGFIGGVKAKLKENGIKPKDYGKAVVMIKTGSGTIVYYPVDALETWLNGAMRLGATGSDVGVSERNGFIVAKTKNGVAMLASKGGLAYNDTGIVYEVNPSPSTPQSRSDSSPKGRGALEKQVGGGVMENATEAQQLATEAVITSLEASGIEVVEASDAMAEAVMGMGEVELMAVEEAKRRADAIEGLTPIAVTSNNKTKEELSEDYKNLPSVEKDGRVIEFYNSAFKKIYKEGGLFAQVVPQLDEILKQSVLAYSENDNLGGIVRPDGSVHKAHENVESFDNYVGKVEMNGTEYYVRITVQNNKSGEDGTHSFFVTNVNVYKNPTESQTIPLTLRGTTNSDGIVDTKLQQFFDYANGKLQNPEFQIFGGNSGYVGYSMSKRAAEARAEGRYPKTDFKKVYNMPQSTLDALVKAYIIDNSEWHHTSKYGNKTTFYGWWHDWGAEAYAVHKKEIDRLSKSETLDLEAIEAIFEKSEAKAVHEKRKAEERAREKAYKETFASYRRYVENAKKANLPDEYTASNGVVIKTNGSINPDEWQGYYKGEKSWKSWKKDASYELLKRLNENLPTFEQWKKENKDKVNDVYAKYNVGPVEFLKTPQGVVYGWTDGKKVYLTKEGMNPETPIHEYTHLWARAMMQGNAEGWQSVKDLLRGTPVWNEVMSDANYADIHGDEDAVASECLARLSGKENAKRMEAEARKIIDEAKGVFAKADAVTLVERMKKALQEFWNWVGKNLFDIKSFGSIEEVTDRVLWDLVNNTELETIDGAIEKQIIGERGASALDKADEATHRMDNLGVARDMEAEGKDAKAIRMATGWERGGDGKWRYEIEDARVKIPTREESVKEYQSATMREREAQSKWEAIANRVIPSLPRASKNNTPEENEAIRKRRAEANKQEKELFEQLNKARDYRMKLDNQLRDGLYVKLSEIMDPNSEVFKSYPQLRDITITIAPSGRYLDTNGYRGSFEVMSNSMFLDWNMSEEEMKSVLLHEVQHAIQHIEGFSIGSNIERFADLRNAVVDSINFMTNGDLLNGSAISDSQSLRDALSKKIPYTDISLKEGYADNLQKVARKYGYDNIDALVDDFENMPSAFEQYHRTAGEVESRNVQARMGLTPEQRRATLLSETEDVAREDQIFLMENSGVSAMVSEDIDINPLLNAVKTLYEKGKEFASKLFQRTYFDVARTPDFMKRLGLRGDKFTVKYGVIARHVGKDGSHDLSERDWKQLPQALQTPFAITKLKDKKDSYRIYTTLQTEKGEYVVVGVDVKNVGRGLEVNSISTAFGRRNNANLSSSEEVIYKDKNITPNQSSLLERPNFAQYPTNQELSTDKGSENVGDVQEEGLMFRDGEGAMSDSDVSVANDPIAKIMGKSQRSGKQQAKFAERERKAMRNRVAELAEKMHLDNVEVVESSQSTPSPLTPQSQATAPLKQGSTAGAISSRKARAKGWFDTKTGKIVINISNHTSVADVERTLLHEAVAHYGLRELFGKQFDTFLDNVFNNAEEGIRKSIIDIRKSLYRKYVENAIKGVTSVFEQAEIIANLPKTENDFTHTATEEYLAGLAEDTNFEALEHNWSWWQKIKQLFMDMLESIGWNYKGPELSDNELRYLLWRSYENMVNPGRHRSILGMAEDVAKQYELGVGNYSAEAESMSQVAERGAVMVDNQGNPIDEDGKLIVEQVSSIDEITDADFDSPTRSIQLPSIPPKVDEAIGANGKPIVIKKNVFEKNKKSHKDLTPKDSRAILLNTLYSPDLYGQNQKITRPYNWILIHLADTNTAVVVEVNENKDNVEVVNWHYLRGNSLEQKKRQAIKEGGLILTLESAAGDTLNNLSSDNKGTINLRNTNELGEKIAEAESEVNTNPTEAQKEAGNYKKGHVQIGTFNVTIEQPKGSVRRGVDADGKKWETEMQNTYGYIRGTEGVDGDHIDVFLSDDIDGWDGHKVFVVDQRNADGSFDEHKVMLGFNDINDAEAAYMSNYKEGWQGLGAITGVSIEEFEKWIASSHRKTKAFAEYKSVKTTEGQSTDEGILFRDGESDGTREEYNRKVRRPNRSGSVGKWDNLGWRMKEAYQDSMLSLKELQEVIAKKYGLKEIPSWMNAYLQENLMSSRNKAASDVYMRDFYNPMMKEVQALIKEGVKYEDLVNYMIAKHGLERNVVMAERDAKRAADEAVKEIQNSLDKELNKYKKANELFNQQLQDFESNSHEGNLVLGEPSPILEACGIDVSSVFITPKTLKAHLDKHGLTINDIKDLPKALLSPLMVYEWGTTAKSMIVITHIPRGEQRITIAIKLERGGKRVEVNEIASIHGKDSARFIDEMIKSRRGGLSSGLKYVDKENALNWLGIVPPKGTAPRTQQERIANIIEKFENPTTKIQKIQDAIRLEKAKFDGVLKNLPLSEANKWYDTRKKTLDTLLQNNKISLIEYGERVQKLNTLFNGGYVAENRKRDYSGLTALTGEESVMTAEKEAEKMVEEFEGAHETDALWEKVNAATKETLRKSYEGGLMSKETYESTDAMYEHYIPLRGWDSDIASVLNFIFI